MPHVGICAGGAGRLTSLPRPLPGGNLSADFGAKTRLGPAPAVPSNKFTSTGIGINALNPRGLGTCVREDLMDLLIKRNQLG